MSDGIAPTPEAEMMEYAVMCADGSRRHMREMPPLTMPLIDGPDVVLRLDLLSSECGPHHFVSRAISAWTEVTADA